MTKLIANWLLECGIPAIQYQTWNKLHDTAGSENVFRNDLICCADTQRLINYGTATGNEIRFQNVHGATNQQTENILPMLLDRGLDNTFPEVDEICGPILKNCFIPQFPDTHCFHWFPPIILVPLLLWAGYRDKALLDWYHWRLDLVSGFCKKMDFDIFAEDGTYKGIPKPFWDRRVIRPCLYQNGAIQLPMIYDLYGYRAMYGEASPEERDKINTVLGYIMSGPYQQIPRGYGLLRESPSHYYAMGWDAVLPRCKDGSLTAQALHRMELLSKFPCAVRSPWFQENLALVMACRREDGRFLLPKAALQEKESVWVLGGHMGLGENRRKKDWSILVGTFRVYRMLAEIENR